MACAEYIDLRSYTMAHIYIYMISLHSFVYGRTIQVSEISPLPRSCSSSSGLSKPSKRVRHRRVFDDLTSRHRWKDD